MDKDWRDYDMCFRQFSGNCSKKGKEKKKGKVYKNMYIYIYIYI